MLTNLAAGILRDAAQVYIWCDVGTWLSGYNPVLTAWNSGMFGDLESTAAEFSQASAQQSDATSQATLKRLFRLPDKLPPVRLPPAPELAALARSAPVMGTLEELARWLGRNGRAVTKDKLLHDADAADAVDWLGVQPGLFPYLWENALVTGWIELVDRPDGSGRRAVVGKTAYRWADGDVLGALHVWATVFAAVLATTLEVSADQAPRAARRLNFQGQGVALAIILFLARRTGLTTGDASDIVQDGAIGDQPTGSAKKAWDAWVRQFGDPASRLVRELVALRALAAPAQDDSILTLSPLAQWALREQLRLEGISIRVILSSGDLPVADLIELTEGVSRAEFNTEFEAWSGRRAADRAALDLLIYAASANAQARLTAVNLVRRLGPAAADAWLTAIVESPQLRGYAHMALSMMAADLPVSRLLMLNDPDPDNFAWVAADLLSLIGTAGNTDPGQLAARFAEAIPPGKESWALRQLAGGSYPGASLLLELLGRYHPEQSIAKEARKAARRTAKNWTATRKPTHARRSRTPDQDIARQDELSIL